MGHACGCHSGNGAEPVEFDPPEDKTENTDTQPPPAKLYASMLHLGFPQQREVGALPRGLGLLWCLGLGPVP